MDPTLRELLASATAPLVLISGIGILVLSINARYTHALSRVRDLHAQLESKPESTVLSQEIEILIQRCRVLKWSYGVLVLSTLSSGLLVILSVLSAVRVHISVYVGVALILFSCCCIFTSMLILFFDILLSMRALKIHISKS